MCYENIFRFWDDRFQPNSVKWTPDYIYRKENFLEIKWEWLKINKIGIQAKAKSVGVQECTDK